MVNKSGETMADIVTAIKRVNDIMSEIAAASSEQATGIQEVNNAVVQMDEMTQQNAALVEEAAAAADSMRQQSGQLAQRVAVFKVGQQSFSSASTSSNSMASFPTSAPRAISGPGPSKPRVSLNPMSPDEAEWEAF